MEKIVSRFRDKLVRMTDAGSNYDNYSVSPKLDKFYCIGVMN